MGLGVLHLAVGLLFSQSLFGQRFNLNHGAGWHHICCCHGVDGVKHRREWRDEDWPLPAAASLHVLKVRKYHKCYAESVIFIFYIFFNVGIC